VELYNKIIPFYQYFR